MITSKRIRHYVFGMAVFLGVSLYSCGTPPPPPSGSATLYTYWTNQQLAGLQSLGSQFEAENPGSSVNLTRLGREDIGTKMTTMKAAGVLSDIFQFPLGPYLFDQWAAPGDLANLDEIFAHANVFSNTPGCFTKMVSCQCHSYALPAVVHRANVLWFNEDILKQAGINAAGMRSYDDWFAALQTISHLPNIFPLALKDSSLPSRMALFEAILMGTLGTRAYKGLWDGTTPWTSQEVSLALRRYQQISQYVSTDQNPGLKQLANGVAAMVLADDEVYPDAAQSHSEGRLVMGGGFQTYGGQTQDHLARTTAEGATDSFWQSAVLAGSNTSIHTMALQAPGKIIVGGWFDTIGGIRRSNFARLNSDGSLDPSFFKLSESYFTGTNGGVFASAIQPDGKILLGGNFNYIYTQPRAGIARLMPDGSLDPDFSPDSRLTTDLLLALLLLPDGHLMAGGLFKINGETRYIIRLDQYGNLDDGFNPAVEGYVHALAADPDGNILIGGEKQGTPTPGFIVKLRRENDGSYIPDPSFAVPSVDGTVHAMTIASDGQIFLGGYFTHINLQPRNYLAKLTTLGQLDANFTSPISNKMGSAVYSLVIPTQGEIIAGGNFSTASSKNIVRLRGDTGVVDNALTGGPDGEIYALLSQPSDLGNIGWMAAPGTQGMYSYYADSFTLSKTASNPGVSRMFLSLLGSANGQQQLMGASGSICVRGDCDYRDSDWYLQSAAAAWMGEALVPSLSYDSAAAPVCLNALENGIQRFLTTGQAFTEDLPCVSMKPVFRAILISGPNCHFCETLKEKFRTLQAEFCEQLQIEELETSWKGLSMPGEDFHQLAMTKFGINNGIPLVLYSGTYIHGDGLTLDEWRTRIREILAEGGTSWPVYLPGFTPSCW